MSNSIPAVNPVNGGWSNPLFHMPHVASVYSTHEAALIASALSLLEERRLKNAPVLQHMEDFEWYLRLRFAGLTNEQAHVLYLNINRELVSAEVEFFGNQKSVDWNLRQVAARAIALGAEHVVLAHNHPNNNPNPSEQDLRHLEWAERALAPLGINLLDSFVVTASAVTSIKEVRTANQERESRERAERYAKERADRSARYRATRAANAAKRAMKAEGASP